MDFTLEAYRRLLVSLLDYGYRYLTVREAFHDRGKGNQEVVILRHDVDERPENSLITSKIEYDSGIRGTYYFRVMPESFNKSIISEISSMGHEIGYHYEDMELARRKAKVKSRRGNGITEDELASIAVKSFSENLTRIREIADVDTICMHGTPLSPVDSRLIWKYYDYHNYRIIAEPYFDFTLEKMLYLTDTGRRWDGEAVSVRDRVYKRSEAYFEGWKRKPLQGSAMLMTEGGYDLQKRYIYRRTADIIEAGRAKALPVSLMMTVHPQRWENNKIKWAKELITQNAKNHIKHLINIYKVE